MKSPKQLRAEICALTDSVSKIRDVLQAKAKNTNEPTWGVGKDCAKTGEALEDLLKHQVLPEKYKVAVVGRFKAGKSSFVNELLGAKLAGEDTSPETAAVTTFTHGETVKATIKFITKQAWENLKALYEDDPKHVDAHRVKMWESFRDNPRKNADGGVVETFDLAALEREYISGDGASIEIVLGQGAEKNPETAFRKRLKTFTSGTRPLHCLVEEIEISSPAPILDEGVLLIDTPGLDDTERFRVSLTERAVEDVDAILFLTKSGVAYGQSEKDFLLTLLRKGSVKQLIFVITQVDQTYEQHLRNANNNDEDPLTLPEFVNVERSRIQREIDKTLIELSEDDSPSMRRYREQLGDVGLAFTSAINHRDWKAGKHVEHRIHEGDPGGIDSMKAQLLHLLSTESRLSLVAHNITHGTQVALHELITVITNRQTALRDIKDGEVARQRLITFREEFDSARERFQSAALGELDLLKANIKAREKENTHIIETIGLLADKELTAYQMHDVAKHWRTRRSGYWGYMSGLQSRVANKIFPKVQQLLSALTNQFALFADHVEKHLNALSGDANAIADRINVGGVKLNLTKTLRESLNKSLLAAGEMITDEEGRIVSLLDDFVSDEVDEKISLARERVGNVFGQGTTAAQSRQVSAFYEEVKNLLKFALTDHLVKRSRHFGEILAVKADEVPRNAIAEVQAALANAEQDILAAAMAQIGGEREKFDQECIAISAAIQLVIDECTKFMLADGTDVMDHAAEIYIPAQSKPEAIDEVDSRQWFDDIMERATVSVERIRLLDGESGWPVEKIFRAELFSGCSKVVLIDPYLALPHQLRNLKEFLLAVAEAAKPKEIQVVTSGKWNEGNGANIRSMNEAGADLYRNYGTNLSISVDYTIHDRYVICDHGVLYKLGRGLDIYKPATGLAPHRSANRRVRRTDIDVFATEDCAAIG